MKPITLLVAALASIAAAAPSQGDGLNENMERSMRENYYSNGPGQSYRPAPSYWQNNYKPKQAPPPPSKYSYPPPPPPPQPQDVTIYEIENIFIQVNIYEIGSQCKPGSYACSTNPSTGVSGWTTCNQEGQYVYTCDCPPSSTCGLMSGLSPVCWPFSS
ncbi:hypothetical protein B0I35DRAFT_161743 [Stachybotrys elegans]|uniref:EGF-like domain-containing protein n=1 Tax=Stachybotrys elegans TaxID=80388 RepID=A0A8K0WVG9_9HYPO|nr:hypothetical protein B0I35DRAFT_161743 [Stachybotrys elegans]